MRISVKGDAFEAAAKGIKADGIISVLFTMTDAFTRKWGETIGGKDVAKSEDVPDTINLVQVLTVGGEMLFDAPGVDQPSLMALFPTAVRVDQIV